MYKDQKLTLGKADRKLPLSINTLIGLFPTGSFKILYCAMYERTYKYNWRQSVQSVHIDKSWRNCVQWQVYSPMKGTRDIVFFFFRAFRKRTLRLTEVSSWSILKHRVQSGFLIEIWLLDFCASQFANGWVLRR